MLYKSVFERTRWSGNTPCSEDCPGQHGLGWHGKCSIGLGSMLEKLQALRARLKREQTALVSLIAAYIISGKLGLLLGYVHPATSLDLAARRHRARRVSRPGIPRLARRPRELHRRVRGDRWSRRGRDSDESRQHSRRSARGVLDQQICRRQTRAPDAAEQFPVCGPHGARQSLD